MDLEVWFALFRGKTYNKVLAQGFSMQQAKAYSDELCDNVLEYLALLKKCGYVEEAGHKSAVQKIITQLDHAEFLPQGSGLYGNCENGVVQINRNLPKEKRKLYMFHELAHISTGIHQIIEDAPNNLINGKFQHSHLYGYQALDEAMAQDIAETMLYLSLGRQRPAIANKSEPILNTLVPTNFDFYGIYQPIAGHFAQSLRGIGSIHNMCKYAVNGNLYKHIIDEYRRDGVEFKLDSILAKMGNIFKAKLSSFGGDLGKDYIYQNGREITKDFKTDKTTLTSYYAEAVDSLMRLKDTREMLD